VRRHAFRRVDRAFSERGLRRHVFAAGKAGKAKIGNAHIPRATSSRALLLLMVARACAWSAASAVAAADGRRHRGGGGAAGGGPAQRGNQGGHSNASTLRIGLLCVSFNRARITIDEQVGDFFVAGGGGAGLHSAATKVRLYAD
jgi:hypothetical protein